VIQKQLGTMAVCESFKTIPPARPAPPLLSNFLLFQNLAQDKRVIVIEHNYRLGMLGFLGSSVFRTEGPYNTTGNFALQDQQRALNFTFFNIAKFGGDPKRILIFGQSAGAMSICWHLVSPISRGLFSTAIMESGTCSSAEFFVSSERAELFAQQAIHKLQCEAPTPQDIIRCIRNREVGEFFMAAADWLRDQPIPPLAPLIDFGPTIDGSKYGLLARPIELIKQKQAAFVPLIMGVNKDEGTLLVAALPEIIPDFEKTDRGFNLTVLHLFNESALADIIQAYPAADFDTFDDRVATILRDFFFLCATTEAAALWQNKAYVYYFDAVLLNWLDYDLFGNYHSLEIPFIFNNPKPPTHNFNAMEVQLSASFQSYWASLAMYGQPNHDLTPQQVPWPTFDGANRSFVHMQVPTFVESGFEADKCRFWSTHYSKYYFEG